ncbi:tetratricopeptide repeat-containing sulfotransferase family protein [Thiohalobacter thiocyanaticus]|nr:tetratricopeptide repeat-containing sulfotransferase family protein [Thiohalobacter thiocyanaticus]
MQTDALKSKALEHFRRGQLKKSQALYEKVCRADTQDVEALYMLGSTYAQSGNYCKACNILEKALKMKPDALPIHCALGATRKAMGEAEQAITHFRSGLGLSPENTDIKLELAGLLLESGELSEAESLLQSVIQGSASDAAAATALHGLGEIRHLQRRLDESVHYYQRALQAQPNRPMTHNRLGHALHSLGRLDEAIDHYRKAISQAPDFIVAYTNLANTLINAGLMDEADKILGKALSIDPDNTDAVASRVSVLEHKGDYDAAHKLIVPLLEKGVHHSGLGIAYANLCHRIDACDSAAHYLESLLQGQQIPDNRREQLHYAAGRLHDRLNSFDTAFRHFQAANNLRPDHYSSVEHRATIHAQTEVFDPAFIANAPRATHGSRLPVFIVGMPRSGTSLTEQILAQHGDVHAAGELAEIEQQAKILCSSTRGKSGFPACFEGLTRAAVDTAAQGYLKCLEEFAVGKRYVTDKMPQNFIFLGLINLLFPDARVIHCMRDPRDVCLSIYFQNFSEGHSYATRLEHIADYYLAYQRLMHHWKSALDIPILDLRYEELIMNQETTSRRLLDFLDLEWDPRCLDFHRSDRHVATSSYDQVRQPLYTRSMGRWRQYREHIAPLLEVFGEAEIV